MITHCVGQFEIDNGGEPLLPPSPRNQIGMKRVDRSDGGHHRHGTVVGPAEQFDHVFRHSEIDKV